MTSHSAATPNAPILCVELDIPVELHLLDGELEKVKATIHRVSIGLFELSSPIYLRYDRRLEMVCEGRGIESRVAYCRRQAASKYHVAIRLACDAYIRTETRFPINLPAKLHMPGSCTAIAVTVIELSPAGLGMQLATPIPVGAMVSVDLGYGTAQGEIRHCASKADNYRAGIRLLKFSRSTDANAPVLTNLNSSSGNLAALAAFVRSVEERQSRSEAILFSLTRSKPS